MLTKRSLLYIFSKRYQKFCKTYQYLKVDRTKYAKFFFFVKLIKFKYFEKWEYFITAYLACALRRNSILSYDRLFISTCQDMQSSAIFCQWCYKWTMIKRNQRSSAVYQYDTSTNAAFFENFPDYHGGYQCW